MLAALELLLHVYVEAPLAMSVPLLPLQSTDVPLTFTLGLTERVATFTSLLVLPSPGKAVVEVNEYTPLNSMLAFPIVKLALAPTAKGPA